jgi:hypothetical protein
VVTLSSTSNCQVGYSLYQTDSGGNFVGKSIITAVNDITHVTVTDTIAWEAGTVNIYQPISVYAAYTPIGANVAFVKHWGICQTFFRSDCSFSNLLLGFASDFDTVVETTTISPALGGGFGTVPFGEEPWGGANQIQEVVTTLVPANKARCHWLFPAVQHSEAASNFACTGINLFYNIVSGRAR